MIKNARPNPRLRDHERKFINVGRKIATGFTLVEFVVKIKIYNGVLRFRGRRLGVLGLQASGLSAGE
jgi:hypothetical protein